MENARRKFLKKVAYTTPIVVGLGTLVQPTKVDAKQCGHQEHNHGRSRIIQNRNGHGQQ